MPELCAGCQGALLSASQPRNSSFNVPGTSNGSLFLISVYTPPPASLAAGRYRCGLVAFVLFAVPCSLLPLHCLRDVHRGDGVYGSCRTCTDRYRTIRSWKWPHAPPHFVPLRLRTLTTTTHKSTSSSKHPHPHPRPTQRGQLNRQGRTTVSLASSVGGRVALSAM